MGPDDLRAMVRKHPACLVYSTDRIKVPALCTLCVLCVLCTLHAVQAARCARYTPCTFHAPSPRRAARMCCSAAGQAPVAGLVSLSPPEIAPLTAVPAGADAVAAGRGAQRRQPALRRAQVLAARWAGRCSSHAARQQPRPNSHTTVCPLLALPRCPPPHSNLLPNCSSAPCRLLHTPF